MTKTTNLKKQLLTINMLRFIWNLKRYFFGLRLAHWVIRCIIFFIFFYSKNNLVRFIQRIENIYYSHLKDLKCHFFFFFSNATLIKCLLTCYVNKTSKCLYTYFWSLKKIFRNCDISIVFIWKKIFFRKLWKIENKTVINSS